MDTILTSEFKVKHQSPVLLCDNQSAMAIAHNPVLHSRTKHLELDIHFVGEKVLAKALQVVHVPQFNELKTKLKVVSLSHLRFEGGVIVEIRK